MVRAFLERKIPEKNGEVTPRTLQGKCAIVLFCFYNSEPVKLLYILVLVSVPVTVETMIEKPPIVESNQGE